MGYDLRIVRDTWEPGGADGGIATDEYQSVELGASLLVRDGEVTAVFRTVATG